MNTLIEYDGYVRYVYEITEESDAFIDIEVTEINAWDGETSEPILDYSEKYLTASIKWDCCSHWWFGDEGYLHLCGVENIKNHLKVVQAVWDLAKSKINMEFL